MKVNSNVFVAKYSSGSELNCIRTEGVCACLRRLRVMDPVEWRDFIHYQVQTWIQGEVDGGHGHRRLNFAHPSGIWAKARASA